MGAELGCQLRLLWASPVHISLVRGHVDIQYVLDKWLADTTTVGPVS